MVMAWAPRPGAITGLRRPPWATWAKSEQTIQQNKKIGPQIKWSDTKGIEKHRNTNLYLDFVVKKNPS